MRGSTILIAGAATFFLVLLALFSYEGEYTGKATTGTHVNISQSTPANCTVSLAQGYNTISVPCITTAEPLVGILNGSEYTAAYQYVPGDPDPWRVDAPTLPSYVVSDLQYLSRRTGYVVIMNASKIVRIQGFRVASTSVPLVAGWNLVGYPSVILQNASDVLTGINNFTVARTFNTSQQTYLVYANPGGGTIAYIVPGEGYWINATQSTSWTVSS